jgi:hypothetical protein
MKTRPWTTASLALIALVATTAFAHAGTMSVAWDPVADAAGYTVYYGTAPDSYSQQKDVPGGATSTTLTGLDACTRYYVAVKAYDSGGLESDNYSNEIAGLPRPVVSTVEPGSGEQGTSPTLVIGGESFDAGATVEFSGSGITVLSVTRDSCTQLTVDVQIDAAAPTGARTVDVVNPDRSFGSLANGFTVVENAAPTVSSAAPAAGATDVAVNVNPQVVFSEAMDPASITADNVQLRDASGTPVAQASGSPTLSADGLTATIDPASDLDYESEYAVWVRGGSLGVRDVTGNAMAADWQQSPAWTTANQPDEQGPSVTGTTPADGATDVPVDVQPTVTFDEALAASSVTASTVQVLDATGAPVTQAPGSPALSADGLTVTITPASPLAENATYKIRVLGGSGGVQDLAGNPMDQDYEHTQGFEVENLPPGQVTGLRRDDVK